MKSGHVAVLSRHYHALVATQVFNVITTSSQEGPSKDNWGQGWARSPGQERGQEGARQEGAPKMAVT